MSNNRIICRDGSFLYELDRPSDVHGSRNIWGAHIQAHNGFSHVHAIDAATLMAAAPELLKVLTVVRDTLPHIGGSDMSVNSLLHDIEAAIVKATGESQ